MASAFLIGIPDSFTALKVNNNRAVLEVHNIGGGADFTAKARAIVTIPDPELYTMVWESVGTTSCPIFT